LVIGLFVVVRTVSRHGLSTLVRGVIGADGWLRGGARGRSRRLLVSTPG